MSTSWGSEGLYPPDAQEVTWLGVRPESQLQLIRSFIHSERGDSLRAHRGQRSAPTYSRLGGRAQGLTRGGGRGGLRRRREGRGPSQVTGRSPKEPPQQDGGGAPGRAQGGPAGRRGDPPGAGAPAAQSAWPACRATLGAQRQGWGGGWTWCTAQPPLGPWPGGSSCPNQEAGLPPGPERRQPRVPASTSVSRGQSFSQSLALGQAPGELLAGPHAGQHQGAGAGLGVRGGAGSTVLHLLAGEDAWGQRFPAS